MASAVKVAVRVRPLNGREKTLKSDVIITMNDETTFLKDPSNNKPPKSFNFDHSFHSMNSRDDQYASQEMVYNSLGKTKNKNWKIFKLFKIVVIFEMYVHDQQL